MKRRDCLKLIGVVAVAGLSGCGTGPSAKKRSYRFGYQQTNYLRPPGALPEKMFVESCINCGNCAQVCPTECIRFFTQGFEGRVIPHTPYVVAAERACNLCLECTHVCPSGALEPVNEKKDVRMGLALLKEDLCLPYINQGGCGACYTICPVNAIYLDRQRYPKVVNVKCVGCGLCEEVCLQKVKAIRIFSKQKFLEVQEPFFKKVLGRRRHEKC